MLRPLPPTGTSGAIHDARRALGSAGFAFSRVDLDRTLVNFRATGHNVLIEIAQKEAPDFIGAIEAAIPEAEAAASAVAVVAANPAVPLVAFAEGLVDSGAKFFVPPDRIISHGTNLPGYIDGLPALEAAARQDPKLTLLLRLYRASVREPDIDHRLLFQLILLEEASDAEEGSSFAERLRAYLAKHGMSPDSNTSSRAPVFPYPRVRTESIS